MPIRLFWKLTLRPYYHGKTIVFFSPTLLSIQEGFPPIFALLVFHSLLLPRFRARLQRDFDFCIPVAKCHLTDATTESNRITSLFHVLRDLAAGSSGSVDGTETHFQNGRL